MVALGSLPGSPVGKYVGTKAHKFSKRKDGVEREMLLVIDSPSGT